MENREEKEGAVRSRSRTWEGGVVHLAGSGYMDGDRDRDGHWLGQSLRLGLFVTGVRPEGGNLGQHDVTVARIVTVARVETLARIATVARVGTVARIVLVATVVRSASIDLQDTPLVSMNGLVLTPLFFMAGCSEGRMCVSLTTSRTVCVCICTCCCREGWGGGVRAGSGINEQ